MYRIISLIVLLATFAWVFRVLSKKRENSESALKWYFKQLKFNKNNIKNFIYAVTILCAGILAVTGIIPYIIGVPLSGILLLIHVAVSPLFILCVVVAALIWADGHKFTTDNWIWIKQLITGNAEARKNSVEKNDFLTNFFFWAIIMLSISLGSIVICMYPIFGTVGQTFFLNLHKLSAIIFTMCLTIHTCILISSQN